MANVEIRKKINKIQEKIGPLVKDTDGYNYKYPTLEQVQVKLAPLLKEHGLMLLQPVRFISYTNVLFTEIWDIETSERVVASIELPKDADPQDMGSAITYYRRYLLVSLFNLQAEDDDGASFTKKPQPQKKTITKVTKQTPASGTVSGVDDIFGPSKK